MFVTIEELEKIAGLAKLSLKDEDTDALLSDMADIISIAQSINDADLSRLDCEGDSGAAELRGDTVEQSLPADELLSNAAKKRDGFFISPALRSTT